MVGKTAGVEEAELSAIKRDSELIDMGEKEGEHTRLGATDVVPLITMRNETMEDCVEIARRLCQRVGDEFGIPVYLYEKAATRPERVNLADIRRGEYEGLRETIADISPIEDYTGTLAVEFGDFEFGDSQFTIQECREKDLTYQAPLSMTVRFVNKETGEIREQSVFMGDFPWMTERGTFVINGTERVVVTQLVRSPGAYVMAAKDREKQVFIANLMPARGSWLELEIDKKGLVNVRIDRKRKLPITTLLRALPAVDENTGFTIDKTDEGLLALFGDNPFIRMTLEKDPSQSEEAALIEVFKKQRPGEPPTVDNSRNLVRALFFDPKRYDLTKVGRYKLNQRLEVDVPDGTRALTTQDILSLVRRLVQLPTTLGVPEDSKDYAADAITLRRTVIVRTGKQDSASLLLHEAVHVRQWRRYGVIGFLVRYLSSYVVWRVRRKGHRGAYLRIPLEIEADWIARRQLATAVRDDLVAVDSPGVPTN